VVAVGLVIGLILGCTPFTAVAAGIALYLPPGLIVAGTLGGLLRLPTAKQEGPFGRTAAAGLLVGVTVVSVLYGLSRLTETGLELERSGRRLVGEIASTGWLALPTFILGGVMVLLAARSSANEPDPQP
jgi:hypothetical protein